MGALLPFVDLDPRFVKRVLAKGQVDVAKDYQKHVAEQAATILKHRTRIQCLFTTPKLVESIGEVINIPDAGIKGIFCGGTELTPQYHRFAREELIDV